MGDTAEREFSFLPLTIAIETLGGISTPLILRGTPLPATRSQVFSTAADNQSSVEVNIIMGESPIAKQNVHVAKFLLKGIPNMTQGKPQIVVTFEIDRKCSITASALEKTAGSRVEVKVDTAHPDLSEDRVRALLRQAETTRAQDEAAIKSVETKNRAKTAIRKAESLLRQIQESGNQGESYRKVERALAALGLVIDTDQVEEMRARVEVLESAISEQSRVGPFSFEDFFAGPSFNSIFGTQPKAKQKPSNVEQREVQSPPDRWETRDARTHQTGKIFGGGEFTLDPNLCFVLMPFEEELRAVYEDHIRPVVTSTGLSCTRADEIIGTGPITRDIWEKINRARLIVADLTKKNPNVFYELGIAHTLGKDVILITQTMDDVPFDLNALRCIVYSFTPRGMHKMESSLHRTVEEILRSS